MPLLTDSGLQMQVCFFFEQLLDFNDVITYVVRLIQQLVPPAPA